MNNNKKSFWKPETFSGLIFKNIDSFTKQIQTNHNHQYGLMKKK